jgi:hypothetical protein
MALQPLSDSESLCRALVAAYNGFVRGFVDNSTTYPHADITGTAGGDYRHPTSTPYTVTAADATTTATLRALCQNIYRVYSTHIADDLAHEAADATNVIAAGLPADDADQTALNTFLNQAKAAYNLHRSQSGVHFTNDSGNAIGSADATDAASSYTLANEIKVDLSAHVQAGPAYHLIKMLGS